MEFTSRLFTSRPCMPKCCGYEQCETVKWGMDHLNAGSLSLLARDPRAHDLRASDRQTQLCGCGLQPDFSPHPYIPAYRQALRRRTSRKTALVRQLLQSCDCTLIRGCFESWTTMVRAAVRGSRLRALAGAAAGVGILRCEGALSSGWQGYLQRLFSHGRVSAPQRLMHHHASAISRPRCVSWPASSAQ